MKKLFVFAIAALMSASMFASTCAEVLAAINKAGEGKTTAEMTVVGYVTEMVETPNPLYKNISFWIADEAGGAKVIEIYRLSWKDKALADIPVVGDQVTVKATFTLYKPKTGDAIPETKEIKEWSISKACDCIRWTDDDVKVTKINVATAMEIGNALADNETTKEFYRVEGYVTAVKTEQSGKPTVTLSDELGKANYFKGYNCTTSITPAEGDFVAVSGQIYKYVNQYTTIEISGGILESAEPQAINNVNAESVKAMKVIEDGQLFIIRNGVKYNAAGAIVK